MTKPFRLLFIAPQPFYEDRGTPIVILEELKCLSSLGFMIDVLTYPLGQDVDMQNVKLIRVNNTLKFRNIPIGFSWRKVFLDLEMMLKALLLVKNRNYKCIHGVEDGAIICLFISKLFKIPMVYDMHSSMPEQLKDNLFFSKGPGLYAARLMEKVLIRNANIIMASKGLSPLIFSIKPDCDVKEWVFDNRPLCCNSNELANQLGISNRPTVAYIGNFAPYQGVELLIAAIAEVHKVINKIALLLVGGTEEDIAILKSKVDSFDLKNNVLLIHRVSRDRVADFLSVADVLLLPRPRGENAPLKIYEYDQSGKPIVATNIPAHELIADNPNSVMVQPSVDALAEGIIQVLKAENICFAADSPAIQSESPTTRTLPATIMDVYHKLTIN
jgi:glycosyltransferase involved in cell wall biosynthesis